MKNFQNLFHWIHFHFLIPFFHEATQKKNRMSGWLLGLLVYFRTVVFQECYQWRSWKKRIYWLMFHQFWSKRVQTLPWGDCARGGAELWLSLAISGFIISDEPQTWPPSSLLSPSPVFPALGGTFLMALEERNSGTDLNLLANFIYTKYFVQVQLAQLYINFVFKLVLKNIPWNVFLFKKDAVNWWTQRAICEN